MLLIDSIGELASLYSLADLAFVGGSLVARGGHNIIEPAQYGVQILVGKHTENFRDIVAVRVVDPDDLPLAFVELLADDTERRALGHRALETLESQRGATQFTLQKVHALLASHMREANPA